jgi:hypothetical protein
LNSNALNVLVGLLVPGTIVGLGGPSNHATLTGAWYVGLTVIALTIGYGDRGLRREAGALIVAGYLVFVSTLLATVRDPSLDPRISVAGAVLVAVAATTRLLVEPARRSLDSRALLLPGWSVHRLLTLGLVWDEGVSNQGCCDASPGGGHVPFVVITNNGPRGVQDDTASNHYSLVATIQEAFGLGCTANFGGVQTAVGFTCDRKNVVPLRGLFAIGDE